MGDDWLLVGQKPLRRTSRLVLVGTRERYTPTRVLREVRAFSGGSKRIIPIDFDNSLDIKENSGNPLFRFIGDATLRIYETEVRIK